MAAPPPVPARRLSELRRKLNWSRADLARALEATASEVEGWEAGLWRPRDSALLLLTALEKGSALYYSAVDEAADSSGGCPQWRPLKAATLAEARAEAEEAHAPQARENHNLIIIAENRALKEPGSLGDTGFRVAAVWSARRGWVEPD